MNASIIHLCNGPVNAKASIVMMAAFSLTSRIARTALMLMQRTGNYTVINATTVRPNYSNGWVLNGKIQALNGGM